MFNAWTEISGILFPQGHKMTAVAPANRSMFKARRRRKEEGLDQLSSSLFIRKERLSSKPPPADSC